MLARLHILVSAGHGARIVFDFLLPHALKFFGAAPSPRQN